MNDHRVYMFGEPWDAPVCEGAVRIATPTNDKCLWCEEQIVFGDQGTMIPVLGLEGVNTRPQHKECALRAVLGSIGHLLGHCSCHGGTVNDFDELSARENAKLVWAWVQEHGLRS